MRLGHGNWLWIAALVAAMLLPPAALRGHAANDGCGADTTSAGDVTLRLSLKNGQTVFREGEIIALTTEYTASEEKKYLLNTAGYDRSGRLSGMDVFCIEPDNGTDPLADYFNSPRTFIGGGMFGEQELDAEPRIVSLELNEWESLPPGSYRLSIVSNRVSDSGKEEPHGFRGAAVPLRSNTVEFTVETAEPEWQAAQWALATKVLDGPDAGDEEKKHAARVLRFLGSEAATRELARRYTTGKQPFGWELKFGLYGSPHRTTAIEAMKTAQRNPQHAVTREFVDTLVTLEMRSDAKYRLPKFDPQNQEAFYRAARAYDDEYTRRTDEYMAVAAGDLEAKVGEASALSAGELLQAAAPATPEARARWRRRLIESWGSLPVRTQNELIESRWAEVGGPEWMPILEAIVAGKRSANRSLDKPDRAAALSRIAELSPERGHQLILAEIGAAEGDVGIEVLGSLPEHELPRIEAPLMAKLQKADASNIDFQLLDRYATARVLPQVKAIYEPRQGSWACIPQTAMLRYFLRADPDYGVKQVAQAMGKRTITGCYRTELGDLKEFARMPRVESLAIKMLDDDSREVARDAAQALMRYGSAKVEAALWVRLEKFHRKWKDQPDESLHPQKGTIDYRTDSGLELALVEDISDAQAWFAGPETIDKLMELSSPVMQDELDRKLDQLKKAELPINLYWLTEGDMQFDACWYHGEGMDALMEKLGQFPAGTRFGLATTWADREAHRAEFDEVANAAGAVGMSVRIQTRR